MTGQPRRSGGKREGAGRPPGGSGGRSPGAKGGFDNVDCVEPLKARSSRNVNRHVALFLRLFCYKFQVMAN